MSSLKENNDARRKVFAKNLSGLIEKKLRLNKIDAANALGVDYGWLRKASAIGLVRPDNRSLPMLTKISDRFDIPVADFWRPDLLDEPGSEQEREVKVVVACSYKTGEPLLALVRLTRWRGYDEAESKHIGAAISALNGLNCFEGEMIAFDEYDNPSLIQEAEKVCTFVLTAGR